MYSKCPSPGIGSTRRSVNAQTSASTRSGENPRSLTVKIRRERALLILKRRERADVMNAALLVKRRHRFSSNDLAA